MTKMAWADNLDGYFRTPPCTVCKKTTLMQLPTEAFRRWSEGALIQDAFPGLSVDVREQMMTGICPDCWLAVVGPEDQ